LHCASFTAVTQCRTPCNKAVQANGRSIHEQKATGTGRKLQHNKNLSPRGPPAYLGRRCFQPPLHYYPGSMPSDHHGVLPAGRRLLSGVLQSGGAEELIENGGRER